MAFVPSPGVFQVELVYSYQGSKMEQVLHFAGLQTDDPAKLEAMANNAFTMWSTTFRLRQVSQLNLIAIKATHLAAQNSPAVEVPFSEDNAGAEAYPPMPGNVALCITMRTMLRGRSYRGRTYLPGITGNSFSGSNITGAVIADVITWFDSWEFLDVEGEPYANVVLSRYHDHVARVAGVATPVTGWSANPVVASQRRRLPGRGA